MIEEIVEEIRQLSLPERRNLLRRLQINGLLDLDEQRTDRNARAIAPAVRRRSAADADEPSPQERDVEDASVEEPAAALDSYRSTVSGRVVVGSPSAEEEPAAPSEMQPLPGQAPERPIKLFFDGGSKGNPGQGYGSYALDWPGHPRQVVRLQFGDKVTNNEAEYDTLIAGVEAVLKRLSENHADAESARIEIWGDSQLVIKQVNGEWQARNDQMRMRRDRARSLLKRFGVVRLRYHGRENNVEILGH